MILFLVVFRLNPPVLCAIPHDIHHCYNVKIGYCFARRLFEEWIYMTAILKFKMGQYCSICLFQHTVAQWNYAHIKKSIFYHSTWVERFKNRCEKMVAILKIQDGVMSSFHYMHLATYRK